MITILFGKRGTGKTSLMTAMAVDRMVGQNAFDDIAAAKQGVKKMNKMGMHLHAPEKHVVYANYAIESEGIGYPKRRSYLLDPQTLGFANDDVEAAFVSHSATICIMEAQRYYNSRDMKGVKDWQSRYIEGSRQFNLKMILDVQRLKLIDLNVRDLADQVICITGQRHHYDRHGDLIKTQWRGRVYYDAAHALSAQEAGKIEKEGAPFSWTYHGDIYKCYDSYAMMPVYLDGHYDRTSFDLVESARLPQDLESVKAYNAQYSFIKKEGKK